MPRPHPMLAQIPKTEWSPQKRARYNGRKEFYDRLIALGVDANRALARTINFDPLKQPTKQKGKNDRKRHKGSNAMGRSRSKGQKTGRT